MLKKVFPFLIWLPEAKHSLKDDLIAGITGTIIVIPQAVAFAMIAGLPPVYGFYTAMVTPIVAALFGSSYHLISGPTTAISIVVYFVTQNGEMDTFESQYYAAADKVGGKKLFQTRRQCVTTLFSTKTAVYLSLRI